MSITLIRKASTDPLSIIASKMEGKLCSAFLAAVASFKDRIELDELVEAIQTGDVNQAMAILALDRRFVAALNGVGQESSIQSFRNAIQEAFIAGATTAATQLPSSIGVKLSFDLMNPETVSFLERYTFPLIQQISQSTTEAIRGVLLNAFKTGGHPYEQARQIKTFIGLTANQVTAVQNYRKALSGSNTLNQALNRALRDGRFDPTIRSAMLNNKGLSPAQIDKMVARYQERYLQYRAQSIARTESVRASNKGQHALWNNARTQGLLDQDVLRRWIVSGDPRTCEECGVLDGTVVGLNEEFAPGVLDPGDMHTDCRCSQALVFPKAA